MASKRLKYYAVTHLGFPELGGTGEKLALLKDPKLVSSPHPRRMSRAMQSSHFFEPYRQYPTQTTKSTSSLSTGSGLLAKAMSMVALDDSEVGQSSQLEASQGIPVPCRGMKITRRLALELSSQPSQEMMWYVLICVLVVNINFLPCLAGSFLTHCFLHWCPLQYT